MKKLTYCTKCVMPDSKPFLTFDADGVCAACRAHETKQERLSGIDWTARKRRLDELVEQAKARKAPFYDVLVPVSGGKDSIFQIHVALKYGLRVLAVNVDYGIKTEIGRQNLELIPKMGASLIIIRPEQKFHTQMIRLGFEDYGDPDLMSHGLLFAYPLWTAVQFQVPLVFEGENSAFEYGGDEASRRKFHIDRAWFLKHVMTKGITVQGLCANYDIPEHVLKVYDFPEAELAAANIEAVFLSCFFPWDSEKHLEIAREYGFQSLPEPREGTFRNYVGIDEKINRVHQYMKVLKFGYGRATDHACEEIRSGRMTRAEAITSVRSHDRRDLSDYYVDDFVKLLRYTKEQFWAVLDKYRNREIWQQKNGQWRLDDSSFDEDMG